MRILTQAEFDQCFHIESDRFFPYPGGYESKMHVLYETLISFLNPDIFFDLGTNPKLEGSQSLYLMLKNKYTRELEGLKQKTPTDPEMKQQLDEEIRRATEKLDRHKKHRPREQDWIRPTLWEITDFLRKTGHSTSFQIAFLCEAYARSEYKGKSMAELPEITRKSLWERVRKIHSRLPAEKPDQKYF